MTKKRILRLSLLLLSPLLLFGLWVLGNIIYGTITDYSPAEKEQVPILGDANAGFDSTIRVLNWNIGYAGLGAEADFFYDGGKMVRSPQEKVKQYFDGIKNICVRNDDCDFILLQEVDVKSKRSYYLNQHKLLMSQLPDFNAALAINYNCRFIPIPFMEPMGKTYSGLLSFSKQKPNAAVRYQFPSQFPYPKRLYFLDRCMLVTRYAMANGKELLVINAHFSAYDDSGELKRKEMDYFKKFLLEEYAKGNYILTAADWNQCPPGFNPATFSKDPNYVPSESSIDAGFLPADWKWVYDPSKPTNRSNLTAYDPAHSFSTIIDYYLLSPNLQALSVATYETAFAYSDHQAVRLELRLK